MLVAKVTQYSQLSPLLTFYKLKVFVSHRGSYGGFHKKEITQIAKDLKINPQTLRNHIKTLQLKGLITKDLTNSFHYRVRMILPEGRSTAMPIPDKQLLEMNVAQFKSFAMELQTEDIFQCKTFIGNKELRKNKGDITKLSNGLRPFVKTRKGRKTSKLNGTSNGSQLREDQRPISCSYQGLKLSIHKSTVSRWRKQNAYLYSNRVQVTDYPVEALPYLRALKMDLENSGAFFISKEGKVCYRYISLRDITQFKVRVRRKKRNNGIKSLIPLNIVAENIAM